jgi:hypothetical protein
MVFRNSLIAYRFTMISVLLSQQRLASWLFCRACCRLDCLSLGLENTGVMAAVQSLANLTGVQITSLA